MISKWSPKAAKMIKEEIKMNDTYPLNESLSLEESYYYGRPAITTRV